MPKIKRRDQISEEKLNAFIDWLIEKRNEMGLNQTEMAEHLGFSISYYNGIEKRRKNLSPKMLVQIAQKLDENRFIVSFLGPEIVGKYMNINIQSDEEAAKNSEEDALIERVQEAEGVGDTFRLLQAILHESNAVFSVRVQPSLSWFGYFPERHIAVVTPATDIYQIKNGQLLYFLNRHTKDRGFLSALVSQGVQRAVSLERVIIENFQIPMETHELSDWNIDPNRALFTLSLTDEDIIFYEVIAFIDADPVFLPPIMAPTQAYIDRSYRKGLIYNGIKLGEAWLQGMRAQEDLQRLQQQLSRVNGGHDARVSSYDGDIANRKSTENRLNEDDFSEHLPNWR